MNRVPFDKLLQGVQDKRDPSSQLALFGKSEKLKRIETLEASVALMSQELTRFQAKVDEMGKDMGNDNIDIRKLKLDMVSKHKLEQEIMKARISNLAYIQDQENFRKAIEKHIIEIKTQQILQGHEIQRVSEIGGRQIDTISWLKDCVYALSQHQQLPLEPRAFQQSIPTRRPIPSRPGPPEHRIVPYRPPKQYKEPLYLMPPDYDE